MDLCGVFNLKNSDESSMQANQIKNCYSNEMYFAETKQKPLYRRIKINQNLGLLNSVSKITMYKSMSPLVIQIVSIKLGSLVYNLVLNKYDISSELIKLCFSWPLHICLCFWPDLNLKELYFSCGHNRVISICSNKK